MGGSSALLTKGSVTKGQNTVSQQEKTNSSRSNNPSINRILHLQKAVGNEVVQGMIRSYVLQTKLKIGEPHDKYEQEADSVAEKVMTMPVPGVGQTAWQGGKEGKKVIPQRLFLQTIPLLPKKQEEDEERVQPMFILMRKEEEEEEDKGPVLTKHNTFKRIYRKMTSFLSRSPESPGNTESSTSHFESSLSSSKGSGFPIADSTRAFMESQFEMDFSGVRLHTDSQAVQMSEQINAQAFTHGNDIYFNRGKYNPDTSEGRHLLAHELTHTVQQGASVQKGSAQKKIQEKNVDIRSRSKVQRSWLGDVWDSMSGAVSGAADFVSDILGAGLNWIKTQFSHFVQEIPGYKLLAVVLGRDPISGSPVARNGRNFIEAGLDIIPFGDLFKRKLEETGALEDAATWLDNQMEGLDISLPGILADLNDFWDSLSLKDIGRPMSVLNRAANIIKGPIAKIVTFAGRVAKGFLRIVKNYVISELAAFVHDNTRGYPLLTVILGRDPITEEPVERNGMNLIRGFMLLSEKGEEQLRQMEETGSLQRAADWIDLTVARLDLTWETIRNIFIQAWNLISIENLMRPMETFQQLIALFAGPVGRIINFLIEVGFKILEFIKNALLRRLSAFARKKRGYPLITVILGKDPFTEEPVARNPENIIHGFMSLTEGGEEQFQQMKESGAIQRTTTWIEGAVARLGFTWEYITGLFIRAWDSFSLQDLAAPIGAFVRIVRLFAEPIRRLFAFICEVIKKVIEILLIIMKFPIDLVRKIITKAMEAIEDIKKDPVGFLKNLLRAIKQGFTKFFDNILTHLLQGLTCWLFSELKDAGISPPQDLSLRSIFGFVLEVLNITIERIWHKLGERIGHDRVARIRGMIDKLKGIWRFVKDVMTRGPIAIWEYIVEKISNLWNMVLEHVKNWVMTRIVKRVVAKLLSMLDPSGIMAVVNSVKALYNAIESFIRYIREMLEIVNSFVEGIAEIAKGDISRAADFLENSLGRAMPIAIGFLANQVGLSGVGRRIGEMIEAVREKVDKGLDWLIDKAVKAGTSLLNMLRGRPSPEEVEQDDSPEGRKQRAAEEVKQAMQEGIRRSALVSLLRDVKSRYQLRDASLNAQHDVVLENSPTTKLPGRPLMAQVTSTPSGQAPQGQQDQAASNLIQVGYFSYDAENVETIRGALSSALSIYKSQERWPFDILPEKANRPKLVDVTLKGALGSGLKSIARNNEMTRLVGYFGKWESGLRNGNLSYRKDAYDGGHIIANRFGGDESFENLVPQQSNFLNRRGGMYYKMEDFIHDNLTKQSATQMPMVQNPELHFVARFTYPEETNDKLWRVASVTASAFFPAGAGINAWNNFMNKLPQGARNKNEGPQGVRNKNEDLQGVRNKNEDPQGVRNKRVSVPARIPTDISVDVTLRAVVTSFDPESFTGTLTKGGDTIVTGSVSDPLIILEDSPVISQATNIAQADDNAQPQLWRRVFSFTQSNKA
jgi:hypothetical protein